MEKDLDASKDKAMELCIEIDTLKLKVKSAIICKLCNTRIILRLESCTRVDPLFCSFVAYLFISPEEH